MADTALGSHHKKGHFNEEDIFNLEGGEEEVLPEIRNFIQLPGGNAGPDKDDGDAAEDGSATTAGGPAKSELTTHYVYTTLTHKKSSPAPPPTPLPTEGGDVDGAISGSFQSLKNLHQGTRDGLPAELAYTSVHQKHSNEKNAQNPEELPEGWTPPSPTAAPTPGEEEDATGDGKEDEIMRVNQAPDYDGDDDDLARDGLRKCESSEGVFGDDRQSSKNGGGVLRYQYELVQDVSYLDSDLERDILPLLEAAISDWLLPTFFPEECLPLGSGNVDSAVRARGLLRAKRSKYGGNSRGIQNVKVVGLSGAPPDFPLDQQVCATEYNPLTPDQEHQCHVIEGALTVYFPPSSSASSLLSATTLTTLKSIHQGMSDGSLAQMSHPAILQLVFLESSYSLTPILPEEWGPRSKGDSGIKGSDGSSKKGVIAAAVLVPLILLLCCAAGFLWWRRQQEKREENDDDIDAEFTDGDVEESTRSSVVELDAEGNEVRTLQERMFLWARFRHKQRHSEEDEIEDAKRGNRRRGRRSRPPSLQSSVNEHSITSSSAAESSVMESSDTETDTDTDTDGDEASMEGSTTDGSTTDGSTTDENDSTASSDSDSSSEEDTDEDDDVFPSTQFDLSRDLEMLSNPNFNNPYSRRRKNRGPAGSRPNRNIVIGGAADEDSSVATGMTGMSEKTEKVSNRYIVGANGVGDDVSVATGATGMISESTAKISNVHRL
mmetsp:Transcript_8399/g.17565  ORF Transcript_8399/g.17565 Transcript_8399/m.17565 type:complete len:718 (+) Transcript_8399:208-2361(+)